MKARENCFFRALLHLNERSFGMKNKIITLALAVALLLPTLASCAKDVPSEETDAPTDSAAVTGTATVPDTDPDTPTETEPETEPALPLSAVSLTAMTLSAADGGVTLTFAVGIVDAPAEKRTVELVLSDADGEIARKTLDALSDTMSMTLPCPAERISGELTLTATAVVDDRVIDELILKMKDQLPQLTPDGVRCVVAALTDEEKADLVVGYYHVGVTKGISGGTVPIERLGVPATLCMDGPAGVRYNQSVWYPAVINVSSSWDPALAARVGQCLGEDTLAHGFDIVLAPGANIQKNVLGGRNFEYSSEDPLLTGLMIASYVNGIESTGAGTSVKHFAANNQETGRGSISANVTERALREIYLKGFGIVIKDAQPMTVMSSYNRINGTHTAASHDLLTEILRGEFGFEGLVFSDWGAQGTMVEKVNAGNDMNMPGDDGDAEAVLAGLASGAITESSLNACCYHILKTVADSATFRGIERDKRVDFVGHGKEAAAAATDTMVLLKNEGDTLPLAASTKVAVFGNGAVATLYGGAGSGSVTPRVTTSILTGLNKHEGVTVVNAEENPFIGCQAHDSADASKDVPVTVAYAEEMAAAADVAVIVFSRNSSEGSDHTTLNGDFRLNDTESEMLSRVSAAFRAKGGKVVVLLNIGTPMEIVSWRDLADAIVWIGYPGQGAGTAVAQVLCGEVNPSGKTTITWPATYNSTPTSAYFPGSAMDTTYYEDIYVGYRYYTTFEVEVAYPFGYGLSYTSFSYDGFELTQNPDGTVSAAVTVRNTGKTAGREVAELYVTKPETLQEQAVIELCGFAKTGLLAPGESETVTISVRPEALMTYDTASSRWIMDKGTYTYQIGASSAVLYDAATVTVGEVRVVQDVENRCVPQVEFDYIQKDTYKRPGSADDKVNLALNKPIVSNSDEGSYVAANAVDGDYISRWSGLGLATNVSAHTLDIDLGRIYAIGEFRILWESIHAPFSIYYSEDGKSYTLFDDYMDDGSMRSELNLYGTEARFIRLSILRTGLYTSVFEIEMYEATEADIEAGNNRVEEEEKVNIAEGKHVQVSCVEGAYVGSQAVDGNISTRWSALQNGEGWIVVDLGKTETLTGLHIMFESAWVPYFVEVSTDGNKYEVICNGQRDQLLVKLTDLSVDARYIRVRRDGENWFSIYELMAYAE